MAVPGLRGCICIVVALWLLAEAQGSPAAGGGGARVAPNRGQPNAEAGCLDVWEFAGAALGAPAAAGALGGADVLGGAGVVGAEDPPSAKANGQPRARIYACPMPTVPLAHGWASLELNGYASEDGDDGTQGLTYAWSKVYGPPGDSLEAPRSPVTRVIFRAVGVYRYQLTVDDGQRTDNVATSQIEISVTEPDCNANGIPDPTDIENGTSADCNRNGVPDECDLCGSYLSLPISTHPTGAGTQNPVDVLALDADGDGKADLVAANRGSSNLVLLRGDGKGAFLPAGTFPIGGKPWKAVGADFDGNGTEDVASANRDSKSLSVLFGGGDGTFGPPRTTDLGFEPWGIAKGDIDGDGDLDLVVVGGDDDLQLLLNDGSGGFDHEILAGVPYPNCVASGDVDDDGDVDLIVGAGPAGPRAPGIAVLLNRGDGSFADPIVTSTEGVPVAVTLADLDGDGDLDVAFAPSGPMEPYGRAEILTFLYDGKGGLLRGAAIAVSYYPHTIAAADFDGDGDQDLATASEANGIVSMMCNRGDGTFQKCVMHFVGGSAFRLAVCDLDADADLDLFMACGHDDTVAVVWNDCNLVSKDCNGNGIPDECDWATGVPGACEPSLVFFTRGDANADGEVAVSDPLFLLGYLFGGGEAPECEKSLDCDDDGKLNLTDAIYLLSFLFRGGAPIPGPHPLCGPDPTRDSLTCEAFSHCDISAAGGG